MAQQTAVEWLMQNIEKTLPNFIEAWGVEFEQAKQIEKEQAFQLFKAGQDSMEEGGKNFEQYYEKTYGSKLDKE